MTLGTEDPTSQVSRRWPPQLKHKCPLSISPLTRVMVQGGGASVPTGPGPAHVAAGGSLSMPIGHVGTLSPNPSSCGLEVL